jgi:acetyl-CoA acetyltransferase
MIEDVGVGNVGGIAEFRGNIYGDTIARLTGLPAEVSAFDTNRQCGSSMETLHRVAQSIMVGASECGIAMGVERMGRALGGGGGAPATNRLTEFNKRRLDQNEVQRNMAADHFENFSVEFQPEILDYSPVLSMVQTAQNVAEVYDLSREDLDQFSVDSHRKTVEAYEKESTGTRLSRSRSRSRFSTMKARGCRRRPASGSCSTATSAFALAQMSRRWASCRQ